MNDSQNEAETRAELIDPLLKQCGWGVVDILKVVFRNYTKKNLPVLLELKYH